MSNRMEKEKLMKVLYLSAPYRAGTEWGVYLNIQSAHFYAKELWRKGWCCISPVSNTAFMGENDDFDQWIAGDLELVSRSDAWVGAPGWERSEGCRLEYAKAVECGLKIFKSIDEVSYEKR